MRLNQDSDFDEAPPHYAGSLLVAHPSLLDPNFRRSVVLLTAHSEEDGALGVVVNRPLGQTLGEYDPALQQSEMADLPLFYGGPVAADQLILVAWRWTPEDGTFKLFFGIDDVKACKLLKEEPGFNLRGFLGHSGWTGGQLEAEVDEGAWVSSPLTPEMDQFEGDALWRRILSTKGPALRLMSEAPEDPSVN
ncbi:YqgE/AlgH family protein [Coraliomargarita parva]|uniref:YqgE/AlgH family protein n=1 Tax=Coraliomargarita parva TaxID=3014050 RepID=UPI0022B5D789|nr:YqgE/AlgH family protein [Coraliomargarita parva]